MSPKSKQQQEAADKYLKEKVDTIALRLPKGQKQTIQAHAEARGESVNGFINRAITEAMTRDNAVPASSDSPAEQKKEDA